MKKKPKKEEKKDYSWILGLLLLFMDFIGFFYIATIFVPKIDIGIPALVFFLILFLCAFIISILATVIYFRIHPDSKVAFSIEVAGILAIVINLIALYLVVHSLVFG
jgi:hypothetical protein